MDSSREESSSNERKAFMDTNDYHDKNNYQHHSNHQIHRLEAHFNECPNPDNWQLRKLGEELNLKPKQIKFWFQNKRTQSKHVRPLSIPENREMMEIAGRALAEVKALIQFEEPLWTKSSVDGRLVIDQRKYKDCSVTINNLNDTSSHIESSKEVVVVHMDARKLVEMFMDTDKRARLFPTIVNEAKTIQVLYSTKKPDESFGKVIYEEQHILSPLVPPREFIVLRSCLNKVEENLWVIADVSCHPPNIDFEFKAPICTKRPSGVLIQPLPDGRSKVSWVEHVEVNDKVRPHRLYRELLNGGFGYGARRWTATLERMCERLCLYSIPEFLPTENAGVVKRIEGKRSVMNLGERMLKNFAWIMKMSDKLDFSQHSETNNTGVRISVRRNTEVGEPTTGLIVCGNTSLSIPVPPLHVYNILRNLEIRHQWDVLCHGNPVTEATRFVTGKDQQNNVNFLKPANGGENSELMILQDGFIDALGGMLVYAPMDLNSANSAMLGEVDPSTIAILPSGFIISRDSRPIPGDLDGSRMTLLTVAFQILVSGPSYSSGLRLEESTTTVNTLVSATVQRIKAMLNCNDGQ